MASPGNHGFLQLDGGDCFVVATVLPDGDDGLVKELVAEHGHAVVQPEPIFGARGLPIEFYGGRMQQRILLLRVDPDVEQYGQRIAPVLFALDDRGDHGVETGTNDRGVVSLDAQRSNGIHPGQIDIAAKADLFVQTTPFSFVKRRR